MSRYVLTDGSVAATTDADAGQPGAALARDVHCSPDIEIPCPPDHFVSAWLLLLLDLGVSHGYELCRELAARDIEVGLPILYRKLRRLERDGLTRSHWAASIAGPRRRCYRLTDDGRRRLADTTLLVAVLRDQHDAFLHAHHDARRGRRTP